MSPSSPHKIAENPRGPYNLDASGLDTSVNQSLGRTLHLIRKVAKISQVELGEALFINQASVSRIEKGKQAMSAEELVYAARFFSVELDALITGEIDYWSLSKTFRKAPPFPERYRVFPFLRVRKVLPVLEFMKSQYGKEFVESVIQSLDLEPKLLVSPDQTMGANFEFDLLNQLIQQGKLSSDHVQPLARIALSDRVQGFLSRIFREQTTVRSLIQTFVLNSSHYESNFKFEVRELDPTTLEVCIAPEAHMSELQYLGSPLNIFLCDQRKAFFSSLPFYLGRESLSLVEHECHFRGGSKCVYHIDKLEKQTPVC